ncbi:MAG: hypothetical protein P1U68_05335 [Verrucomicrobiales bacterium]|nr:hypothetical protein [Verrucomicrobiales bacterium]
MKPGEKRLLMILLSLLILGAGVISVDIYTDKRDELESEKQRLELEWVEIDALFEEKETWELRANWLKQNQPSFTSTEIASQQIFNDALAENRRGITTSKHTLLPIEETEVYIQAGVALTATGDLAAIFRWIYDITRPTSFRSVRNLTVRPDQEDPTQVVTQFELLRWYAPPST